MIMYRKEKWVKEGNVALMNVPCFVILSSEQCKCLIHD